MNSRTLYALIVLAFISGIAGIMELSDHTSVLRLERNALEKRLAKYGDGLDEALWQERVQITKSISDEWNNLYWTGNTPGLISTLIQSELGTIGVGSFLDLRLIDVPPDVITLPDGNQVLRFQLTARSDDALDIINALTGIAANQPALSVNELNFTIQEDNSGVITISGYARIIVPQNEETSS